MNTNVLSRYIQKNSHFSVDTMVCKDIKIEDHHFDDALFYSDLEMIKILHKKGIPNNDLLNKSLLIGKIDVYDFLCSIGLVPDNQTFNALISINDYKTFSKLTTRIKPNLNNLETAIKANALNFAQLILEHGVKVSYNNCYYAIKSEYYDMLKLLLLKKDDLSIDHQINLFHNGLHNRQLLNIMCKRKLYFDWSILKILFNNFARYNKYIDKMIVNHHDINKLKYDVIIHTVVPCIKYFIMNGHNFNKELKYSKNDQIKKYVSTVTRQYQTEIYRQLMYNIDKSSIESINIIMEYVFRV